MMFDKYVVSASPSSVYLVLAKAGLIRQRAKEKSKKGDGFVQLLSLNEHWLVDIQMGKHLII